METPKNRSTKRRSSYLASSSRRSKGSASKIVKTMILKDEQRKQNQYRVAKTKRAELLKKSRHIDDAEEEDAEATNYEDLADVTSDESISSNNHDVDNYNQMDAIDENRSRHSIIDVEQENSPPSMSPIEQTTTINVVVCSNLPQQSKSSSSGLGSKLGQSIANKFSNLKNTFKNFVQHTKFTSSTNDISTTTGKHGALINRTSTFARTSTRSVNDLTNTRHVNNHTSLSSKQPVNPLIRVKELTLAGSMNSGLKMPNRDQSQLHERLKSMKKHDSLNSCVAPSAIRTSSSSLMSASSKFTSQSSLNSRNGTACNNNKPVFKISKIKYDDRYLFNEEKNCLKIDKNKYQKLIVNRKVHHIEDTSVGMG